MTVSTRHRSRFWAIAVLMAQGASWMPSTASAQCTYPTAGTSFALNIVPQDGVAAPVGRYMTTIRIGGGQVRDAVVDTGSIGLVINQSGVDQALFQQSKTPAQMLYTSSMDYLWGRQVTAPVTFVQPGSTTSAIKVLGASTPVAITAVECVCKATKGGAGGKAPAVATVPTPEQCSKLDGQTTTASGVDVTLGNCQAQEKGATAWMGVGFGRGKNGAGVSVAENPLVHIAGDQVHQGYVIAGDAITVGLNAGTVQDYAFVPLTNNSKSGPAQWNEAQAVPVLGDAAQTTLASGALLMDVGIDFIILNAPQAGIDQAGLTAQACQPVDGHYKTIVKPGTAITVNIPDPVTGKITASYRTVAKDACAPEGPGVVAVVIGPDSATGPAAYNTGRSLIPHLNYAFDNQCGRLGFKAAAR
ncbi:hypothetical protein [Nitrospirillum iridis]|uniref:Peptidase A2 domain-containing protein n=1 Tax=Nitrospirillum iridis TaxID=765888 RepID=A0A7X0B3W3_9PROT|nr:hypothetical protein [Nitrospirillum iridis]MBB6255277.1 hypothetical protein [Nitrospirillum iridis]